MLKAGKNEIIDEVLKTKLQITALQELRWKWVGEINKINIHSTVAVA